MKVYRSLSEFSPLKNAVVTQGTFDGVHLGHQKILKNLRALADQKNGETVLITFFPHPRLVIQPDDQSLKLLQTPDEKISVLSKSGIDHLLIVPFTEEFSNYSALQFVREILVEKIGVKTLVVGYDHRFGKNREGSIETLKELAPTFEFEVHEIPAHDINEVAVSSTKIRNALNSGKIKEANQYLGYPYALSGIVSKGHSMGEKIGFKTANIQVPENFKLIPDDGVYAVFAYVKGVKYKGMANIGNQPTFNNRNHAIEVHLFEFDESIYNQGVKVELIGKIRTEKKFNNIEELQKQLASDKITALELLKEA